MKWIRAVIEGAGEALLIFIPGWLVISLAASALTHRTIFPWVVR